MSLYHWRPHVVLVLLTLYPIESLATNFTQCFESVISCAQNSTSPDCTSNLNISNTTAFSVLRTSDGSLIPPVLTAIDAATALSYGGCVKYCGSGQEPFSWNDFLARVFRMAPSLSRFALPASLRGST
ncbi:hypothetical protein JVU11DRAFT_10349 [Chiua virens]|nr:hypothetical protein JVU11DRAFT_10349 [Chiua virens]